MEERIHLKGLNGIRAIAAIAVVLSHLRIMLPEIPSIRMHPLMAFNLFRINPFVDNDLVALITIGLIINLSFNKNTLLSLENRFFNFLGRISYGIYIIHPLPHMTRVMV